MTNTHSSTIQLGSCGNQNWKLWLVSGAVECWMAGRPPIFCIDYVTWLSLLVEIRHQSGFSCIMQLLCCQKGLQECKKEKKNCPSTEPLFQVWWTTPPSQTKECMVLSFHRDNHSPPALLLDLPNQLDLLLFSLIIFISNCWAKRWPMNAIPGTRPAVLHLPTKKLLAVSSGLWIRPLERNLKAPSINPGNNL